MRPFVLFVCDIVGVVITVGQLLGVVVAGDEGKAAIYKLPLHYD